ncbi:hypothetical protein [Paenibacillus mucilaginosus]|uniref:hypothetical protein n=1 Tax=Paenibacillus mucilaginosus TaxID=61624 RepID=UPI001EEFD741|nr:hypothetical protein [Paenibacillus mucilaginosus]MCG7212571.1 hypothetical protein [Paenibacillus mucilaginosus]WDM31485.1 hypothetical protein KCX80_23445 [Paenibacillus mucilaginosus]
MREGDARGSASASRTRAPARTEARSPAATRSWPLRRWSWSEGGERPGLGIRIGLEDTCTGPDGSPVPGGNAELAAAALELEWREVTRGRGKGRCCTAVR